MKLYRIVLGLLFLQLGVSGCFQPSKAQDQQVKPGIEVLKEQDYEVLQGKRVGLVTNPTGVDSNLKSTVDILHEEESVNLVALYGPEHGVRGNFDAGTHVENVTDSETGLPVYSLYGSNRKPSPEMLEDVDALVFDIQDIGVRSYTYISTLGLVMEAAAENDKQVVVLDRPNPLGGNRVEGMLWEKEFESFVSQYPVPYVHGLTVGELARMLNGEKMLSEGLQCDLEVVRMKGWKRDMVFEETGLPWVPTSPHIPHAYTPFYYAATGIAGELNGNMIGVGYTLPFQVFALPGLDANKTAEALNSRNLPGVTFRPIWFRPYYKKFKGEELKGVQIHVTNYKIAEPTKIQFHFLDYLAEAYPDKNLFEANPGRHKMFDWVCGSDKVRKIFASENPDMEAFKKLWNSGVKAFKTKARPYLLYE